MKRRVADIIMDVLVENGITDCFAVVGGGAMYLDNALLHQPKLTKYFNHHEQACAMAAESYARASGRMPLVCVTSGPGGTNTLTGVMGAYVDSIPMIVISGQVRYAISVPKSGLKLRTRGVQEFNIVDTVKTMTKYAKMVIEPLDIKMEIQKAILIATTGRKGPVWLDIPQDVQSIHVEENELREYIPEKAGESDLDLTVLNNALKESKRPVLLAGAGIVSTNSRDLFRSLVEKTHIPAVSSLSATDVLYREHDLCFGPIGPCGQRAANFVIQNSDLIISLGCSLGFQVTGFAQEKFAPQARIIAVDIDEQELKKQGINFYHQYVNDVVDFMQRLYDDPYSITVSEKWVDYCRELKARFTPFEAALDKDENDRVCAYAFWEDYYKTVQEDAVLVLGNNSAITSALQIGNLHKQQHTFVNFNCGSMGYDLPAAIGTSIALGREVNLITGDGSIMMNLQELQTIVHHGLPIKIIVFENEGYNAIRQTSKNFFNGELIGCTPDSGITFPSFKKVANAYGIPYLKCSKNQDLSACLKQAFQMKGAVIMEISQLIDDPVIPKVMSRADKNGVMISPALHDMYPFISEGEIEKLMIRSEG